MAKVKYTDLEDAFMFVSSDSYGMNSVMIDKETGKMFYKSEAGDMDEFEQEGMDWEELDFDQYIDVPHKNDLDLGRQLVLDFAER